MTEEILWVESEDYINPAVDYKRTEKSWMCYVAQTMPVKKEVEKKIGGKMVKIPRVLEVPIIITNDRRSIILTPEMEKIDDRIIKSFPSSYGGNRWSRKSMKRHLTGQPTNSSFYAVHEKIKTKLKKYIEFDDSRMYDVVSCWAIGTYFQPVFNFYPLLYLNAVKGSGKSKLLNFLYQICFNAVFCQDPSESTIFRLAHTNKCTILIDEIEKITGVDQKSLRSLLLGSPNRGVTIPRAEQKSKNEKSFDVKLFELYGPRAIANISGIDDVLEDRCITLILKRGLNKEIINSEIEESDKEWAEIRSMLYELYLADPESGSGPFPLDMVYRNFVVPTTLGKSEQLFTDGTVAEDHNDHNNFIVDSTISEIISLKNGMQKNGGVINIYDLSPLKNPEDRKKWVEDIKKKGHDLLTGRNLNVWKPLLCVASLVDNTTLFNVYTYGVESMEQKSRDVDSNNPHITLIEVLIKSGIADNWYSTKKIVETLRSYENLEWVTPQWLGRALKSLGNRQKRRTSGGFQYYFSTEYLKQTAERYRLDYDLLVKEGQEERAKKEDSKPAVKVPEDLLDY